MNRLLWQSGAVAVAAVVMTGLAGAGEGRNEEPPVLTNPPVTCLQGRIIDGKTGRPVRGEGVVVKLDRHPLMAPFNAEDSEQATLTATPDANGQYTLRFTVRTPQPIITRLAYEIPGYAFTPRPADIRIYRGEHRSLPDVEAYAPVLTVTGRVVDDNGRPVRARLFGAAADRSARLYDGAGRALYQLAAGQLVSDPRPVLDTDADGRFVDIHVHPSTPYRWDIVAPGFERRRVRLDPLVRTNLVVQLHRAAPITGIVTDHAGRPAAGIRISGAHERSGIVTQEEPFCISDAQGHFVFETPAEKGAPLRIYPEADGRAIGHPAWVQAGMADVRLRLFDTALDIVVVGHDEKPVPGAGVCVGFRDPTDGARYRFSAAADAAGIVRIGHLLTNRLQLSVSPHGHVRHHFHSGLPPLPHLYTHHEENVDVRKGQERYRCRLTGSHSASYALVGRLINSNGAPAVHATVVCEAWKTEGEPGVRYRGRAWTQADGRFRIALREEPQLTPAMLSSFDSYNGWRLVRPAEHPGTMRVTAVRNMSDDTPLAARGTPMPVLDCTLPFDGHRGRIEMGERTVTDLMKVRTIAVAASRPDGSPVVRPRIQIRGEGGVRQEITHWDVSTSGVTRVSFLTTNRVVSVGLSDRENRFWTSSRNLVLDDGPECAMAVTFPPSTQREMDVRILDDTGKPLHGVRTSTANLTASARGRIQARVPQREPYRLALVAYQADRILFHAETFPPGAQPIRRTIRMRPSADEACLAGDVVDGAGEPVPYARIMLAVLLQAPEDRHRSVWFTVPVDPTGRFSVHVPASSRLAYRFEASVVSGRYMLQSTASDELRVSPGQREQVRLTFPKPILGALGTGE